MEFSWINLRSNDADEGTANSDIILQFQYIICKKNGNFCMFLLLLLKYNYCIIIRIDKGKLVEK